MARLSVIVCTHNPRHEYFRRCLAALHAQTLPASTWDLLIVDNASDPGRWPELDVGWHPTARTIRETTLGLTPARLRAIAETAGDLLVFVDDDNVLEPDFLDVARRVAHERLYLGAWSGQCRPEFEEAPLEWTRRYWGNLVIREFAHDAWSNLPRLAETMPCGAGLCVRREVAEQYLDLHETGRRRFRLDRIGSELLSGGDNDLAACACDVGLGVGLIASLRLTHLIPADRLTVEYLERLVEGISFSSTLLDAERGVPVPVRRNLTGRAADCLRIWRLRAPHRRMFAASIRGRRRAQRVLAGHR